MALIEGVGPDGRAAVPSVRDAGAAGLGLVVAVADDTTQGTPGTGLAPPAGGGGLLGYLSGVYAALVGRLSAMVYGTDADGHPRSVLVDPDGVVNVTGLMIKSVDLDMSGFTAGNYSSGIIDCGANPGYVAGALFVEFTPHAANAVIVQFSDDQINWRTGGDVQGATGSSASRLNRIFPGTDGAWRVFGYGRYWKFIITVGTTQSAGRRATLYLSRRAMP